MTLNCRVKHVSVLFGTASLFAIATGVSALAQTAVAQNEAAPEQVLVTGSLIRGAEAVGVPVVSVTSEDFVTTAAPSISEFLRTIPALSVPESQAGAASPGARERGNYVEIHNLGGTRGLLMVNGMRYPIQKAQANAIDPSIIPSIAVDRIEVLADGASAIYGSDAVSGVINVIMKRGFDGAITELRYGLVASGLGGGRNSIQASQLYGKTWSSGDITVSYHYEKTDPLDPTADRFKYQYTHDYTPWGLDDKSPLLSAWPAVVSTGKASSATGTTCTNCYSVPNGSGANFNAGLNNGLGPLTAAQAAGASPSWATLLGNKGVFNLQNEYLLSDLTPDQETHSFTLTLDQNITRDIQFFADVFYTRRNSKNAVAVNQTPAKAQALTWAVPTNNPYYPVGAPANLQVAYSFMDEVQPISNAGEVSQRADFGFNVALPFEGWNAKIFASFNNNVPKLNVEGAVNGNAASAALGNTIAVAANGTNPAFSFTKPASVPYLNIFCDPTAFQCNSPTAIAYISGVRHVDTSYAIQEYGATFDGPLYALPGGELKAAVGVDLTEFDYYTKEVSNYASVSPSIPDTSVTTFKQEVPAAFVQFNIPVFGADNAIPFFERLDIELSGRYDNYYSFGVTTNPKVAFDWSPYSGVTLSGAWGTSFRAPGVADLSATGSRIRAHNIAGGNSTDDQPLCAVVGSTPTPGSVAAVLNPTCSAALNNPGGMELSGGSESAAAIRPADGFPRALGPETATNTSISLDVQPNFFKGFDVRATYWNVIVSNYISAALINTIGPQMLSDPVYRPFFILNTDPNFATYVQALLGQPGNQVDPSKVAGIKWINDGASLNAGFLKVSGIDFHMSYTYPIADGALTAGLDGTYELRNINQPIVGGPVNDSFLGESCTCNSTIPRMKARLNLGWSDGEYSVNTFVNYTGHYFAGQGNPPAAYLALFPGYSDIVPEFYTFDISLGYNTGETAANQYFRNLQFNLVVNDLFDKVVPFNYNISGNASAYDSTQGLTPFGRTITFIVSKTW